MQLPWLGRAHGKSPAEAAPGTRGRGEAAGQAGATVPQVAWPGGGPQFDTWLWPWRNQSLGAGGGGALLKNPQNLGVLPRAVFPAKDCLGSAAKHDGSKSC